LSRVRSGIGRALLLAGGLALLAGGCRPETAAGSAPAATPVAVVSIATETPVVLLASSPATSSPATSSSATSSPATASPTAAVTQATVAAPPTPSPQATAGPTRRPPGGATPPAPTPTPAPTFTPPAPPPPVAGEHLVWGRPVPASGPTWTDKTYPYGSTRGGMLRPHTGVEFVVPTGTPVLAVAAGTVVFAGDDSQVAYGPQTDFYGNLVILEVAGAADGVPVYALYGHLSAVAVSVGQTVAAGEALGLSGASGVADGPHVHLEARVGENSYGATRNPLLWLRPLGSAGVVAGRVTSPNGELLHEVPIVLRRVDGPAPFTATTAYAAGEPNPDGNLGENFALDDVEPGFYEVTAGDSARHVTMELWVYPGRVNWVEFVLP